MILAATGHRPKDLPCKYDEGHPWLVPVLRNLRAYLLKSEPNVVISGMALGWDTWVAEEALILGIKLWCYIPFKEQSALWGNIAKKRYNSILNKADRVELTSEVFTKEAYLKRNKMMVDDADRIIALWNPARTQGGTFHAINYATRKQKHVKNFWMEPK